MKDVIKETHVRILKIANCPSVSGKSTLIYHIGCTEQGVTQIRIHANTAAGFFSQEWVSLDDIEEALAKGGSHFTSMALQPLFRGKSQNNSAFLLAVLLQEGLVKCSTDKKRSYERGDAGRFIAEVKALIDSKVSLNADDKPAKPAKKTEALEAGKKGKTNTDGKAKSDKDNGAEASKELGSDSPR